ncbi:MAG TPA: pyridoxamine 5'-phosphate oxidase family protein [Dehalococcoidia bacterium]|nr:pyridoxamine 5'-phosphate oxidase family protein [Dehalococcoidia bacterium]
MPAAMSNDEVHEFLDGQPGWMMLSTIGKDGYPHTVPVGFFRIGDDIYTGGRAGTQRVVNIEGDDRVSALFEAGGSMEDIKGVLLQGDAELLVEPEQVLALMQEAARKRGATETELPMEAPPGLAYIRITPHRTISWDYSREG